jgi:hypothetical protein
MYRKEIRTTEPFAGLFPIEEHIFNAVARDMKANGYDSAFPVVVWKGRNICLDGHVRLRAAGVVGLNIVPVSIKDFKGEGEALRYRIHCQRARRAATDGDLLKCVEAIDKRKDRGGDRKSGDFQETKGSSEPIDSAEITARVLGVSPSKVKKIRIVLSYGDDKTRGAVETGVKSIHGAYVEIQRKRKPKSKK